MPLRLPRRALFALGVVPLILSTAACMSTTAEATAVPGQGDVVSEDRTGGEVHHVSVGAGMNVAIMPGPTTKVTLSAQGNLLPLIHTETTDGELVVNVDSPGITSSQPVNLTVIAPDVESVSLSGGAYGAFDTTRDAVTLDVSGGATLEATGETAMLDLTASSGAQAILSGLVAKRATVDASGGSRSELRVVDSLTGKASGGATIQLVTRPASVEVATSSGGMVLGG